MQSTWTHRITLVDVRLAADLFTITVAVGSTTRSLNRKVSIRIHA